jgi:hypothetical protein
VEQHAWKRNDALISNILSQTHWKQWLQTQREQQQQHNSNSLVVEGARTESKVTALHNALQLFFRKLVSCAAECLGYMCAPGQMDISDKPLSLIWDLVLYCIYYKHELLVDRHLHSLLLCCIYAVCNKVVDLRVTFRKIIEHYMTQWEDNAAVVVKSIASGQPGKPAPPLTIIAYYNHVFIPNCKDYITQTLKDKYRPKQPLAHHDNIASSGISGSSSSSVITGVLPRRSAASPRKISKHVYVSKMHASESHKNTHSSPSKSLYCVWDSPAQHRPDTGGGESNRRAVPLSALLTKPLFASDPSADDTDLRKMLDSLKRKQPSSSSSSSSSNSSSIANSSQSTLLDISRPLKRGKPQ